MPIVISGPTTITEAGSYILGADIVLAGGHGIIIAADNVKIDLNGFSIVGNGDPQSQACGVLAQNCKNVTVENGSISGTAYGVYLQDTSATYMNYSGSLVQNLSISDVTYRGIKVEGMGNIVRNNEIDTVGGATFLTDAYAMGIETYGANGLIANNTIDNVRGRGTADIGEGVGICLSQETSGTSVVGNTVRQPSMDVDASYADWPAESRSSYGIFVGGDPRDVTVDGNTVEDYFFGITYGRSAWGSYSQNSVSGSFISYYLLANDGERIVDAGGNLTDQDPDVLAYGRFTAGGTETVEADYLSPLPRTEGYLYMPVRNPTVGSEEIVGTGQLDVVDYWLSHYFTSTAIDADLEAGTVSGGGGIDMLVGIEGIQGTRQGDVLRGTSGANLISGQQGDDAIFGRGGADFLFGGDGDDVINPGSGAILVDGGSGNDTVRYDDQDYGSITISLTSPSANVGSPAGTVFVDIERFVLGSGNDKFYGDAQGQSVYGDAGHDSLFGGQGADYLDGGTGFDYARFDDASYAGFTADLANIIPGTGPALGDTFVSIEGLVLSYGNDVGYGTETGNYLYGFAGDDFLFGRGGNDSLFGGEGGDNLFGGEGADLLDGGSGFDFARYDDAAGGVVIDLANSGGNVGAAAGDLFLSIEGLIGSNFSDTVRGDAGTNVLYGLSGTDILDGRGGNDMLIGGADADRFVFRIGDGFDTILDFQGGTGLYDVLDLSGVYTSFMDVLNASYQTASGLVIPIGAESLLLADFYRGNLAADDVLFT